MVAVGRIASAIDSMPQNPPPRHAPPSFLEAIGSRLTEPHPQFDAVIEVHDIERDDISYRVDDAFAQAEAKRKVFQILRCRHHYGIGAAVICDRYRGLFRNRTTARACTACPPILAMNGSGRFHFCIAPFMGVPCGELRQTSRLFMAEHLPANLLIG